MSDLRQRALRELGLAPLWMQRAGSVEAVQPGVGVEARGEGGAWPETTTQKEPGAMSLEQLHAAIAACQGCEAAQSGRLGVTRSPEQLQLLLIDGSTPVDGDADLAEGEVGRLLDHILFALGVQRKHMAVCNLLRCAQARLNDATLTACAPYLAREIELLAPRVIVALGSDTATMVEIHCKPPVPVLIWAHPRMVVSDALAKRALWNSLRTVRAALLQVG